MVVLFYFLSVLIGYVLGCSNMAFYISKIKKTDLRSQGSNNLGTANALTVCGIKASLIVLVHDLGKSVIAVIIARYAFPQAAYADAVAGAASILGHIFPFYLKFRGGKGYASYMGVMVTLNWRYAVITFFLGLTVTMIVNYMIVCNAICTVSFPIFLAASGDFVRCVIMLVITFLVVYKHGSHYMNFFTHTEPKFWDSIRSRKKRTENPR